MVAAGLPYSTGQIFDATDANFCAGFGDGTDGAFSETAATTTNLVQGTVYQYTSFNLGASHTISAVSTSTKPIIILVSGNATINGKIDLSGKGSPSSYDTTTEHKWGTIGGAGGGNDGGEAGIKGLSFMNFAFNQKSFIMNGTSGGAGNTGDRAGGGGGASVDNSGTAGAGGAGGGSGGGGAGGGGGCSIYMLVGGTLNLGAASSIDVSGANGETPADGAGGGGGGAGDIIIIHKGTKTDSGVTTDVTAGTGGTGQGSAGDGGAGGAGNERILDWSAVLF